MTHLTDYRGREMITGYSELRNDKGEVVASHTFPYPIVKTRALAKLCDIRDAR